MSKEVKLSIAILFVGMLVVGGYAYKRKTSSHTAVSQSSKSDRVEEKIILPQYEDSTYANIPQVKEYVEDLKHLISKGKAVLPLDSSELDDKAMVAQEILLKNQEFLKDTKQDGKLLHNDMMRILPAIISAMDKNSAKICQTHSCYEAEKYNFVTNTTTRAIVDVDDKKVLQIDRYSNRQPDISLRLTHIAQAIALNAPEVKKELGFKPSRKDITMANVRGSMKESPCEDTTHLCVAPTFAQHKEQQALWAVVDLTQMRLAAAKWAGLGKTTTPACIGERTLQNRYIMKHFCQKDTILDKNGWHIVYRLTGSDGLEIVDVSFKGKKVIKSAKIVDWHVAYKQKGADELDETTTTYIEGRKVEFIKGNNNEFFFGYNDAMGCPLFSTSVVLAFNGPQVKPLPRGGGFMLTQDFRNPKWPMACNYRYENRFEFYDDGSFRVVGVNKGRGCGDNALYRPVMRIDLDLGEEDFYSYEGNSWDKWSKEGIDRVPQDGKVKYPYKIVQAKNRQNGYFIEPNHGQFKDNSRGDNATLYVSRFHTQEGAKDLLTLGSCCKLNSDGVEDYINDESISEQNIVLWYVPRIINDTRKGSEYCWADTLIGDDGNLHIQVWPCTVGPKFVPIRGDR